MTLPPFVAPGYIVRSPTPDDIPAIIELLYAHDRASTEEPDAYTMDDILHDWESLDLSADAWVLLAADGTLAAYATLTLRPQTGRIFADGYVHPSYTGQGLGSSIIVLTEARAQALAATFPEDVRVVIVNNIVATSDVARTLFDAHQYELCRVYFTMSIILDGSAPLPIWPEGLAVRSCDGSPEDLYRAYEMIEEGFLDHWAYAPRTFEEWQRSLVREKFDPSLWFLVQEGDKVVAAALGRLAEADGAWVDQLAVLRPWRKQGLGAALLYEVFNTFYRRGVIRVSLGVDAQSLTGAQRLYERVGMHVTLRIGRYEKELRPGRDLLKEA